MTQKTIKLQSLLEAQIGKGGLQNIVVAVQSYDKNLDFVIGLPIQTLTQR